MTRAGSRMLAIAAAVLLGAGTLGCGALSQAKQAVQNVSSITELTDKLGASAELTYTADYKLNDASIATVVQQPPNAAFIGKQGRFILTPDSLLMCTTSSGKTTCQRTPNETKTKASADQAAYLTAVAGGGFINTPMAVAVLTAAAIVPGVKVDKSTKKVAGLESTCLRATGIPQDSDVNTVAAKEFTVCVGGNGLLTTFVGVGTDGKTIGVELVKYGEKVDAKAFTAPAGAKIVDVTQLQPKQSAPAK